MLSKELCFFIGNASLASKIREITDLRRTVPAVISQSLSSTADDQSKIANVVANAISAATALGKRRRAEHNSVTQADMPEKRNSKRCSAITQKVSAAVIVPCTGIEVKRPVSRKIVKTATDDIDAQECTESDPDSGVQRMHIEIARLTEENNMLLSEQFTRETDIRIEVMFTKFNNVHSLPPRQV